MYMCTHTYMLWYSLIIYKRRKFVFKARYLLLVYIVFVKILLVLQKYNFLYRKTVY